MFGGFGLGGHSKKIIPNIRHILINPTKPKRNAIKSGYIWRHRIVRNIKSTNPNRHGSRRQPPYRPIPQRTLLKIRRQLRPPIINQPKTGQHNPTPHNLHPNLPSLNNNPYPKVLSPFIHRIDI